MPIPTAESAIGHTVEAITVLGTEQDGDYHWVGAEVVLQVPPVGIFTVHVVTKGQFSTDVLVRHFEETDQAAAWQIEHPLEERPPYVLNDTELTEGILERKLKGRVVEADLAASLWGVDSDADAA